MTGVSESDLRLCPLLQEPHTGECHSGVVFLREFIGSVGLQAAQVVGVHVFMHSPGVLQTWGIVSLVRLFSYCDIAPSCHVPLSKWI